MPVKSMLKRIEWIKDCGIFEDYQWDRGLPDLGRFNVIYGGNGAGKTSLARALDGIRSAPRGFEQVSIAIEDEQGARTTEGSDDGLFDRVLVFCEDFVNRNHRLTTDEADLSAVLTIGERSVEADRRLADLRPALALKVDEQAAATTRVQALGRDLSREHERIAESVVAAASRAEGRYRSRASYRVDVVERAFAGPRDNWTLLDETALASKLLLVQSDNRTEITVAIPDLAPSDGFVDRITDALRTTPVTLVLDTLAAHAHATPWVQEGQHLHEGVDTCIFCGSPISTERKAQIERHFSDSVSRLQDDLEVALVELEGLVRRTNQAVTEIPDSGLLFADLRASFEASAAAFRGLAVSLTEWVDALRNRIRAKKDNVLADDSDPVPEPPAVDATAIGTALAQHNERVVRHADLVQVTARELELHFLKTSEPRVDELTTEIATATETADRLAEEVTVLSAEIVELESVEGDPTPSSGVLNTEIARLLGHTDLQFQAVDGRYRVTRSGRPAVGLSEGERTAITLVHFLESAARSAAANGNAIVVIDDPVSSLDSNVFMGVSSYMWSECVVKQHVAQLILITHSFELFRQWDIQLERLPGTRGANPRIRAQLFDLRSTHRNTRDGVRRHPRLAHWPPSEDVRKKVRSSYHHAFFLLCEAKRNLDEDDSLERRLDAQLLFPNLIRRLLETFLAFKRPEWVGDFTSAMRNASEILRTSGYDGDADALRLRLTRYAHAHSHSETPATDQIISPDEVRTAISAVFTFMNHVDESHFAGLCAVLGVDVASLMDAAAPPVLGGQTPLA